MPNRMYYQQLAAKRRVRVRAGIRGTASRPRLTVFRSNKHTYAQVIDDTQGKTLAFANSKNLKKLAGSKLEVAKQVASDLLQKLEKQGVTALVFDRGSYKYHGRIKAIAEVLRSGNIKV